MHRKATWRQPPAVHACYYMDHFGNTFFFLLYASLPKTRLKITPGKGLQGRKHRHAETHNRAEGMN